MKVTDIIKSTKGRDAGKYAVVVKVSEDGYMYLVDGKGRGILNPKRKNFKHGQKVGVLNEMLSEKLLMGEKITNNEIRRALSEFSEETNS